MHGSGEHAEVKAVPGQPRLTPTANIDPVYWRQDSRVTHGDIVCFVIRRKELGRRAAAVKTISEASQQVAPWANQRGPEDRDLVLAPAWL